MAEIQLQTVIQPKTCDHFWVKGERAGYQEAKMCILCKSFVGSQW